MIIPTKAKIQRLFEKNVARIKIAKQLIIRGPSPASSSAYRIRLRLCLLWWQEQFDISGCIGCGRCLTWCPAKIDLTENLFGKGWPMQQLIGEDVIVITGGIGSAPVIGAIHKIMRDREHYGKLSLAHGVSHSDELIYQDYYSQWQQAPNTEVLLACHSQPSALYRHQGLVTDFIPQLTIDKPADTLCLMCGPQARMQAATEKLLARAIPASNIFLSLERNMQCGLGHCGHCQCGDKFTCQDGPVFAWESIADFVLSGY